MTLVTFFECPFNTETICCVSLLNTVAFLSLPPVKILLSLKLQTSRAKMPGALAEWRPCTIPNQPNEFTLHLHSHLVSYGK